MIDGLEFLDWTKYLFHFLSVELYFFPIYYFAYVCGDK